MAGFAQAAWQSSKGASNRIAQWRKPYILWPTAHFFTKYPRESHWNQSMNRLTTNAVEIEVVDWPHDG
jgi:hypothetical protein